MFTSLCEQFYRLHLTSISPQGTCTKQKVSLEETRSAGPSEKSSYSKFKADPSPWDVGNRCYRWICLGWCMAFHVSNWGFCWPLCWVWEGASCSSGEPSIILFSRKTSSIQWALAGRVQSNTSTNTVWLSFQQFLLSNVGEVGTELLTACLLSKDP